MTLPKVEITRAAGLNSDGPPIHPEDPQLSLQKRGQNYGVSFKTTLGPCAYGYDTFYLSVWARGCGVTGRLFDLFRKVVWTWHPIPPCTTMLAVHTILSICKTMVTCSPFLLWAKMLIAFGCQKSWNLSDKTSVMVKLGELSSSSYWASHGKKNGWLPMQLVTWRKPNVFPQVSWYHM